MSPISSTLRSASPLLPIRTLGNSLPRTSLLAIQARNASGTKDWEGRQSHEHITNRDDKLNVQASASHAGREDRSKGDPSSGSDGGQSQATTEKDKGNQNEQAKKDHPEAPGPVIGMNDERGGVSLPLQSDFQDWKSSANESLEYRLGIRIETRAKAARGAWFPIDILQC